MIRIQYDKTITDAAALERVLMVVKAGKVSETSRGKQYCFASSWADGVVVEADLTRSGVHSFRVIRKKN